MKTLHSRIERLEDNDSTTEQQVRLMIADKYDPIKEDIREIKAYLMKLIDALHFKK